MPRLELLVTECEKFSSCSHSPSTIRNYESDWRSFRTWCFGADREPLPATPETVVLYLTDLITTNGNRIATAARRAAAINYYHGQAGLALPAAHAQRRLLEGAQRVRCEQPHPKKPLTLDQLRQICTRSWEKQDRKSVRSHSILTLGFSSALRRSNIVELQLGDVQFVPQGMVLHIRKEKQDQLARGRMIGIAKGTHPETCAVRAAEAWIKVRGDFPGPLFVSLRAPQNGLNAEIVALIVKEGMRSIGLDSKECKEYAGHSLRSGFVTEAALNGVTELVIAAQTGHKSLDSLKKYFRATDLFRRNASALIGL